MEKLYSERIKREIEKWASEQTEIPGFDIEPTDLKKTARFKQEEAIAGDEREYVKPKDQKQLHPQARIRAIHSMLDEGRWSYDLGIRYEITKENLIQYYHTQRELSKRLNIETEEEWRFEIVANALQYWEEEKQKAEEWNNTERTALEELASTVVLDKDQTPPYLILLERLQTLDSKIRAVGIDIDILKREIYKGTQVRLELGTNLVELQSEKKQLYEDKIRTFRQMRKDVETQKRFVLINALTKEQKDGKEVVTNALRVKSVNHGFDLLDHYRDWYNRKYGMEIALGQKAHKKETDKAYYSAKEEVVRGREETTRKLNRARELREEGLSHQKIADQLTLEGFKASKSAVQRWLAK